MSTVILKLRKRKFRSVFTFTYPVGALKNGRAPAFSIYACAWLPPGGRCHSALSIS